MNNKILKVGFRYLIVIIIITAIAVVIPNIAIEKELQTNDTQEEVPLQNAVGENEVIAKATGKKKVVKKKKTTKKKQIKIVKRKAKKYTKSKVRKVSTPKVSSNAYQNYAHDLVIGTYGWSEYDFQCLVKLWNRESGWNPNAHNKSSGAHGIPQSLPASKMKSEGADYYTNGYTQIRWGLKYIKGRYGSPAKAWQHSQKKGWY
jgi:hypothetical protein